MGNEQIGFIGLGVMGGGMAARLLDSGFPVTVYNRTSSKSDELGKLGAQVAENPRELASRCSLVMVSLSNHEVVRSILLDGGLLQAMAPGSYIVDMTTVPPAFAQDLADRAAAAGHHALDACVVGNPMHAKTGELRVMVGGDEADFDCVKGVLGYLGKEVTHLGGSGSGATMKLLLNTLMGVQIPALAEVVVLGERAGLPRDKILEMIASSGFASPVMAFRTGYMQRKVYEPASFKLGLMRKDLLLTMAESQRLGVPMQVSAAAYLVLTAAMQQGLADLDVAAVLTFQEELAGMLPAERTHPDGP